jgi:hypothetical protein
MWSQFALFTNCYEGDKIMGDETAVACSTDESSEELWQKLVGQPEVKWPFGRNWPKLQNIKINIKGAGNESDRSLILAHDRNKGRVFVTKETKLRVAFKEWKFLQLLRGRGTGPRISMDGCRPCASTNKG